MITDKQPPAFSPEDVLKNFQQLQSDLNLIQNEFDQALAVWRTILAAEKQEFQKVLGEREKAWEREEAQWQKDRQTYEKKVQELEAYFQTHLRNTEKKAVHALNELDAAWQQERERWQQTVTQQAGQFHQTEDQRIFLQQQLEQRLDQLTQENDQLKLQAAQIVSLESQVGEWQQEKASWEQAHERWTIERQEKDALIESLQQDLASRDSQQQPVNVYMNTLETQVEALGDFVKQVFDPRRRKTDERTVTPAPFRPPLPRDNS